MKQPLSYDDIVQAEEKIGGLDLVANIVVIVAMLAFLALVLYVLFFRPLPTGG